MVWECGRTAASFDGTLVVNLSTTEGLLMVAYIRTIPPDEATGLVKELYDRDLKANGFVPNYTRSLSLHPEIMVAWRDLSRTVRANMDSRRYELVTIAAASKVGCSY